MTEPFPSEEYIWARDAQKMLADLNCGPVRTPPRNVNGCLFRWSLEVGGKFDCTSGRYVWGWYTGEFTEPKAIVQIDYDGGICLCSKDTFVVAARDIAREIEREYDLG